MFDPNAHIPRPNHTLIYTGTCRIQAWLPCSFAHLFLIPLFAYAVLSFDRFKRSTNHGRDETGPSRRRSLRLASGRSSAITYASVDTIWSLWLK
jgi:hypothetical protein